MAKLISYEQAWKEIERIEAEACCELPEITDSATLSGRARRLLDCDDPPRGEDKAFCLRALDGNIIAG